MALTPTPGVVVETVMRSPTAIGPFSKVTLTGTRPARATGTLISESWEYPPSVNPGAVETIPKIDGVEVALGSCVYFLTMVEVAVSAIKMSPASTGSDDWYISARARAVTEAATAQILPRLRALDEQLLPLVPL